MTEPISNCARFAAQPLAGGGTPVEMWTRSDRRFAPLNIEHCPALLLVAAHPDDETLGLGATASALAERGISVQVVAVTDGEAAYPEDAGGRTQLAETRRDETLAAAARLGLARPIFLGIPDGEVTANEDRLQVELEAILAEIDAGHLVCRDVAGRRSPRPRGDRQGRRGRVEKRPFGVPRVSDLDVALGPSRRSRRAVGHRSAGAAGSA